MNFEKMIIKMKDIINKNNIDNDNIEIKARVLDPKEAIGDPEHDDYVIQKGKERLIEAKYKNSRGVAFTDMYGDFSAKVDEIFNIHPVNNFRRAIIIASMNALLSHLSLVDRTIHCKNNGLIICADKVIDHIKDRYKDPKIFQIGLQPRFAERLSSEFNLRITDNDTDNIDKKFNDTFVKSPSYEDEYIKWCDIIFATGSTFVNNTAFKYINSGKEVVFYGVTGAGPAYILDQKRYCETEETCI